MMKNLCLLFLALTLASCANQPKSTSMRTSIIEASNNPLSNYSTRLQGKCSSIVDSDVTLGDEALIEKILKDAGPIAKRFPLGNKMEVLMARSQARASDTYLITRNGKLVFVSLNLPTQYMSPTKKQYLKSRAHMLKLLNLLDPQAEWLNIKKINQPGLFREMGDIFNLAHKQPVLARMQGKANTLIIEHTEILLNNTLSIYPVEIAQNCSNEDLAASNLPFSSLVLF